ncbi:alpha-hydroxy-acid oxidizing protein, partial [Gilvimarinus sp. 1_MG-2023]
LGLDGVVVSNHGGRQLDGASSSLDALARIAPVVDGRISLLLDGGVRRGTDIIKALALGAEGVLLARTTLYGVAAYGGAGVDRVLTIVQEELGRSLNLMGCRGITSLDRRWLLAQGDSQ